MIIVVFPVYFIKGFQFLKECHPCEQLDPEVDEYSAHLL